jgi:GrpB-like predicted nucleotidyltransferase (UPF0157 family)
MKRILPRNTSWKDLFEAEVQVLHEQLGPVLIKSHHIGSIAIVELPAKPVIDVLLEVEAVSLIDERNSLFLSRSYEPRGEYGINGRRYFSKRSLGEMPGYHIHAYKAEHFQVQRHLAFRDFLRLKPDIAAQYANIKHKLFDRDGILAPNYQEAKKAWVDKTSLEALRHFADERVAR